MIRLGRRLVSASFCENSIFSLGGCVKPCRKICDVSRPSDSSSGSEKTEPGLTGECSGGGRSDAPEGSFGIRGSWRMKKVLIVDKVTRYEKCIKGPDWSPGDLTTCLAVDTAAYPVNLPPDQRYPHHLWRTYQQHRRNAIALVKCLEGAGVECHVVKAIPIVGHSNEAVLRQSSVTPTIDAVFSMGGDGTFLDAAKVVPFGLPLFGVNTDWNRSEGRLCMNKTNEGVKDVARRILSGNYKSIVRQRISVTIRSPDGEEETLAYRPLNEVMIAQDRNAPTIYAEVSIDDSPFERQKSSGVLVCTGTGSTAWHYNMCKVRCSDVRRIMTAYDALKTDDRMTDPDEETVREVARRVNQELIFPPADPRMRFVIREGIENRVFRLSRPFGFAQVVAVRPLGDGASLIVDGATACTIPPAHAVVLTVDPNGGLLTAH